MTHIEFVDAGLHNRHIRFIIGGKILSGVVVDDVFHKTGKTKRTHYTFIPTKNMVEWKEAEKVNNQEKMHSLSSVVDIEEITWGEPIFDTRNQLFREVELVQFISELIRKNENFKNAIVEPVLENSRYRADLIVERKKKNIWEKLLIEVKVIPTFTEIRLREVIEQLKVYGKYAKGYRLVFAFPGILSDKDNADIQSNGIEIWDINYIAQTFAKEITTTPHPLFQALFTKTKYVAAHDKLIIELKSIRAGNKDADWSKYQKHIEKVLDYLFGSVLSSPITEHSDHFKINRRDFILRNYAETGFWAHLRNRYLADFIVLDAKNYTKKVTKKEVLQIANYLKVHGAGLFGIIISRNGGNTGCYYTCREVWAMDKKLIIVLTDEDIIKMIIAKAANNDPEEIIRQKIEEFRLSM
ncbi:MAG TPA: hypothetical protein VK766_08750 [Cytophagaceae bacterium]|jgi:hypothetical protein|nr:hypothetical protein [Cytophagaceae bacterium]